MTKVSFPGLGIGEIEINPVAISFGAVEIRWYGLIICLGMILAVIYVMLRAKQKGISVDDVLDIALVIIPCGIVGARLYYVIMEFDRFLYTSGDFLKNVGQTLYNIIAVWNGGLAIYGGIIAGGIALVCVAKKKKLNAFTVLDMVAPAVMIGQILGRWGNFFNGEAHGGETDIFCRMGLWENGEQIFVHPTFLYESLWNLCGFAIANVLYKKKKFEGQIFFFYIAWYGFGRMIIEQLRTDSLMVGVFRISQVVGFMCFIVGTVCMITFANRAKAEKEAETVEYSSVYARLRKTKSEEETEEKTDKELEEQAREDEILSRLIKKDEPKAESAEDDDE
jgi:phosphatidylglycerol:prolipoprotein diacylglycerol transferase